MTGQPNAHLGWDVLNDYADGVLAPQAHAHATQHLEQCEACRVQVAQLKELVSAARAMPQSLEAPDQAWQTIKARVENAKVVALPNAANVAPDKSRWRFVAAAAALVMISSAGTVLVMNSLRPPVTVAAIDTSRVNTAQAVAIPADFVRTEKGYIDTVRELADALSDSRNKLSPKTLETVQHSLKVIDDAIAEARQALAADPASNVLRGMLAKRYEQKVEVLRRASERTLESE